MEDSTIDNNVSVTAGGGLSLTTNARLFQVTIADNLALATQVSVGSDASLSLISSTISGTKTGVAVVGAGVTFTSAVIDTDGSDCVIGDSTCGLSGPGDQVADALLKPLADNGGPVPTILPSFGSPALDRIAPGATGCVAPASPDARQQPRPVGPHCGAGAVENQPGETTGVDCVEPPFVGPGAQLQFCDLSGAVLGSVNLTDADLTGSDLSNAELPASVLLRTELAGADLRGADLEASNLSETVLSGANLSGANLFAALVLDADLTNTDLQGTVFGVAPISRSDLSGANLLFADLTATAWIDTVCPDGTNSDDNGSTCEGHRIP